MGMHTYQVGMNDMGDMVGKPQAILISRVGKCQAAYVARLVASATYCKNTKHSELFLVSCSFHPCV